MAALKYLFFLIKKGFFKDDKAQKNTVKLLWGLEKCTCMLSGPS
jgi:hypothetical protein